MMTDERQEHRDDERSDDGRAAEQPGPQDDGEEPDTAASGEAQREQDRQLESGEENPI